ncbi:hypothetical protein [Yersinia bercovieri]|uniref:hypothetical protein n=1 Tax=Yersinia bercovieri TaxID=634 RepID=UPI0011A4E076|nr:hypothetical protein [Yersinia bercovieri]
MMDITKSREDFETWANRLPSISITGRLERCGENYVDDYHTVFWLSWQASRESILLELPEYQAEDYYQNAGYNAAINDCSAVLRTASIRIKGESE